MVAEVSFSRFPSKKHKSVFGPSVAMLHGFSLFATYVVQLQWNDQNTVISLSTEDP